MATWTAVQISPRSQSRSIGNMPWHGCIWAVRPRLCGNGLRASWQTFQAVLPLCYIALNAANAPAMSGALDRKVCELATFSSVAEADGISGRENTTGVYRASKTAVEGLLGPLVFSNNKEGARMQLCF